MRKLTNFFRSLFSKKKRTQEENIFSKSLTIGINNFYQLSMPVITKILTDYGFKSVTDMFGKPSAKWVSIQSLKGHDLKEKVLSGTVFLDLNNVKTSVEIKIKSQSVFLVFSISGTNETYVDICFDIMQSLADVITKETKYSNLNLANTSVKATVGKSFFGNTIDLQPLTYTAAPKIYLEKDSQFLIEKFLLPCLKNTGKYTALFIGPYGNGKTETSLFLASTIKEEQKTFLYISNTDDLSEILYVFSEIGALNNLAVFVEDIDQAMKGSERNSADNAILNLIDGVEGKGTNLKIIFTTNHENRLNPALRRNGRIDLLVPFNNPSLSLRKEIFSDFLNSETLGEYAAINTEDLNLSVASCVELCKRINLLKEEGVIHESSITQAIDSLKPHLALMNKEIEKSPEEEFTETVSKGLLKTVLKGGSYF